MNCFYSQKRHCSKKITREHIISESVLKVAFGDPIRNISRAETIWSKCLIDHESVIKDVCEKCNNNSLSPYDLAGKKLAIFLEQNKKVSPLKLPFNIKIFGWIIKTHLNFTRVIKDSETNESYPITQKIKNNLIKRLPITSRQVAFYVRQWEEDDYFWDAEHPDNLHYLQYKSIRLKSQNIVMSNFRIRQFDTMVFFPSNNDYLQFDERVDSCFKELNSKFNAHFQKINIEESIKLKEINLSRLFSIQEIMNIRHKVEES